MPLYQQATALENASTANKQTALNTTLGAVSSTLTSSLAQVNKNDIWNAMLNALKGVSPATKTAGNNADNSPYTTPQVYNTPAQDKYGGLGGYLPNAPDNGGAGVNTSGASNPLWNF